ncbi:MAG: alanine--glyoxylate aminotransferase family protein [Armatimonadetes bacterium]|nr:alanine--glyoxylate aminotransferase family protein [Armatimonadota bacterium]
MPGKALLMIPGPTPVPEAVLRALSQPMINHRGPEYATLQRDVLAGVREVYHTHGDVLIFTASGTGGLEASVVNTLSPGDPVLAVTIGAFGERYAQIAAAYGANVRRLDVPWGRAAAPEAVSEALRRNPEVCAVLLTHNETSTGVLNDLPALARVIRERAPEALILVDSISGVLAAPLETDAWDLDVVVAGSQKAWMTPPGLTFLSVSERAWQANRTAKMPRFYFDFARTRQWLKKDQTPFTPAVSLLFGLREALRLILAEGVDATIRRHIRLARAVRAGVAALGLALFAETGRESNAVTAVRAPAGIAPRALRRVLRERHHVITAGGPGSLESEIFRIGHLGYVSEGDVLATLAALEMTLAALGRTAPAGAGVAAAEGVFAEPSEAEA